MATLLGENSLLQLKATADLYGLSTTGIRIDLAERIAAHEAVLSASPEPLRRVRAAEPAKPSKTEMAAEQQLVATMSRDELLALAVMEGIYSKRRQRGKPPGKARLARLLVEKGRIDVDELAQAAGVEPGEDDDVPPELPILDGTLSMGTFDTQTQSPSSARKRSGRARSLQSSGGRRRNTRP